MKRNSYRNPGFIEFDASVMKNTHISKLGEAGNFQLRFDFLNLFNHVNLGPVNSLDGGVELWVGYHGSSRQTDSIGPAA